MQPTPDDLARSAAADLAVCDAATAGPWYAHNTDDNVYMNVFCVTDSPHEPATEDEPAEVWQQDIIAMMLYQSPRVACHRSEKWTENTAFVAMARDALPAWIRRATAAEAKVQHLRNAVKLIIGRMCNLPWHAVPECDVDSYLDAARSLKGKP